jgi:hypothetical protein
MPQAAAEQQDEQQDPQEPGDGHVRAGRRQPLHRRQQPGRPQCGQPPDHPVLHDGDVHGRAMQPTGEDQQGEDGQRHGGDQPSHPGGLQVMGQGWRLPGGTPLAERASDPGGTELDVLGGGLGRLVCGYVHDASNPHGGRPTTQLRHHPWPTARQNPAVGSTREARPPQLARHPPAASPPSGSGDGRVQCGHRRGLPGAHRLARPGRAQRAPGGRDGDRLGVGLGAGGTAGPRPHIAKDHQRRGSTMRRTVPTDGHA